MPIDEWHNSFTFDCDSGSDFLNASFRFLFLGNTQKNQLVFLYWIKIIYQRKRNNRYFLYARWRYSNMNFAMFPHFSPIIMSSGRSLLCSSIRTIMLTLVVSSRLWLIIQWIMLSTILKIAIWFPVTKMMCLWNFYISANWRKGSTNCWISTDNFNVFIFNKWFLPRKVIFLEDYDALLNALYLL